MEEKKQGKLLIFSAPSGSGKSTLVNHLLENISDMAFSISATTREPRGEEVNGREYYFISLEEFKQRVDNGEFLEWPFNLCCIIRIVNSLMRKHHREIAVKIILDAVVVNDIKIIQFVYTVKIVSADDDFSLRSFFVDCVCHFTPKCIPFYAA